MGPTEILVSGGVAAILAAVAGGGLKAFGVELPLLATVKRQTLVLLAGIGLVGAGLVADGRAGGQEDTAQSAKRPSEAGDAHSPAVASAGVPEVARLRVPPVRELPYEQARKVILAEGWIPMNGASNPMHNENLRSGNGPYFAFDKGYSEFNSCAGSGLAQCEASFRSEAGQVLHVVTIGEGERASVGELWIGKRPRILDE